MALRKTHVMILSFAAVLLCGACRSERDYLIIIDTSGSMADQHRTLEKVQSGMSSFLESVQTGDSVTLMRFDTEVGESASFTINEEADRQRVVDEVGRYRAEGRYTNMGAMVSALQSQIEQLKKPDRELFIVVMSDGKDDPPPWHRTEPLDLGEFRDPEAGSEADPYYIYYISLGRVTDPALQQQLETLAPERVRTVEAAPGQPAGAGGPGGEAATPESNAESVGLSQAAREIDETSFWQSFRRWGIWIAAVVAGLFLIGLIALLIYRFLNRHQVKGSLVYYEDGVGAPVKNRYVLDKLKRSKVEVGQKLGADLRLRQAGVSRNVELKAKVVKGQNYLKASSCDYALMKFLEQSRDGLISPGDRFKLGNYILEYDNATE